MKQKGFTLVELLIVVAIIGILSAIAIPQFVKYKKNSAIATCSSDLKNCMSEIAANFANGTMYTWAGAEASLTTGPDRYEAGCNLPGNAFFEHANNRGFGLGGAANGLGNNLFTVYVGNGTIEYAAQNSRTSANWGRNIPVNVHVDDNQANCTLP